MKFTATNSQGPIIAIHATGCKHAVDNYVIVGLGDTTEQAFAEAVNFRDPDNDWPGAWKIKISPCAKKETP